MDNLIYIAWALLLSAFFSGMETAYIGSNKLQFELDRNQKIKWTAILPIFFSNPAQFKTTMLVGKTITMVLFVFLLAKTQFTSLSFLNHHLLTFFFKLVVASSLLFIANELASKVTFKTNPTFLLQLFSVPLFLFYVLLYPLARTLIALSSLSLRAAGVTMGKESEKVLLSHINLSDFNLSDLWNETIDKSTSKNDVQNDVKIFQNALDFSKVRLRDCSVPRTEIIALEYNTDLQVLKQTFIETGFSKIPIYKSDIDHIVGYIHSSEMFDHQADWKKQLKQIPIVPETMTAQKLMKTFLQQKKSMAVVVDEFGGTSGIITLEDIVEEIVGEIEDEHDLHAYTANQIAENEYIISGRMEVTKVNQQLSLQIPESDSYETIAGLILHHHQNFPKLNEQIQIGNYSYKCIKVNNNRVEMVKVSKI